MVKKLVLDCSEELWAEVLIYKAKSLSRLKTTNEATIELIEKGLKNKNYQN